MQSHPTPARKAAHSMQGCACKQGCLILEHCSAILHALCQHYMHVVSTLTLNPLPSLGLCTCRWRLWRQGRWLWRQGWRLWRQGQGPRLDSGGLPADRAVMQLLAATVHRTAMLQLPACICTYTSSVFCALSNRWLSVCMLSHTPCTALGQSFWWVAAAAARWQLHFVHSMLTLVGDFWDLHLCRW
jgi:hypothetical protein